MAPSPPRLRILSVGGNAVSAFLSWRLQATNACDVTLVWKANYQNVAQYGVSFKSQLFGNERFKPRYVVQSAEEAASQQASFDYVLLCVKALPDVYNLADIIRSVVTPQHTCILVNTTNTLGVERQLEEAFPTNVVLSLVSGADLNQLGSSEFEHSGSTEVWVGPASKNSMIPEQIQRDMSEALAMTLTTAQVDCKVSPNIKQQQYERMIGPISFYPVSVLFETPSLPDLIRLPGVHDLILSILTELLELAAAHGCEFPADIKESTISSMIGSNPDASIMYQDFLARRPMEVETYLGTPVQLAKPLGIKVPRIETLYTMLRHVNITNQTRPQAGISPSPPVPFPSQAMQPPPRSMSLSNGPPPIRPPNGSLPGPPRPMRGPNMGPPGRRGPPPPNGFRGPPNSYPSRGPPQMQRRPSYEENNLDEFSHVVLYDELGEGDAANFADNGGPQGPSLRERELMLRERELHLKQQEMAMRGRGGRRPSHIRHQDFDDDDDDDDYFDPMQGRGPSMPPMDPDNFDMMSVTSRRTKRTNSHTQLRKDAFANGAGMRPGPGGPPGYGRPNMNMMGRQRTSAQILSDMPVLGGNILDNPMMGFSSNRYGTVDRKEMADESRANSLTASRLQEMGINGGPYPGPPSRRTSRSPGNPFGPPGRFPNRPSPPNEPYMPPGSGPPRNGRPSPPRGMPAPVARYPPGQGNMVHPHQVDQAGVSKPLPPPKPPVKSLTGSASASAGSGDSGSANIESDPSAHSSTSSFAPRQILSTH